TPGRRHARALHRSARTRTRAVLVASPPFVPASAHARRFASCGFRKPRTRATRSMKHPRTLTLAHWGVYEVEYDESGKAIQLYPFAKDPDPSPIGLHMLSDEVERLRVRRPAVRKSWLEQGPGAFPERRGAEPFVEIPWDEALDLVAGEVTRVK